MGLVLPSHTLPLPSPASPSPRRTAYSKPRKQVTKCPREQRIYLAPPLTAEKSTLLASIASHTSTSTSNVDAPLQKSSFRIQVDKPRGYLVLKRTIFPVIGKEYLIWSKKKKQKQPVRLHKDICLLQWSWILEPGLLYDALFYTRKWSNLLSDE
jgi:hypothetical protein